jgi:selenide,water dikinase
MVQSVDFLTPMVNDPYVFGRIAAANALSDIYAMGGCPFSAMNIVGFPKDCLPLDVLTSILRGGQDVVREAGAVMAGGHTVEDPELKFGLAVTGTIDPGQIATNSGASAGDVLVLTKPVGTGVLATAIKARWDNALELEQLLSTWSGRLNAGGARVIQEFGLKGATDVTGFGLGGHALEMAKASGVHIQLEARAIPWLDHACDLAAVGLLPAGAYANKSHCREFFDCADTVDPLHVDLVFDPQTSGGLLLSVPEEKLSRIQEALHAGGELAQVIGKVGPLHGDRPGLSLI